MAASSTSGPGIPGLTLPGPFPVGDYARMLRAELSKRARVQLTGELFGLRRRGARTYFELRDEHGAVPCAMWNTDWDNSRVGPVHDGLSVVVAGGPGYYPGSRSASPAFAFDVGLIRVAGEGDLLLATERLRRRLEAEGLFAPQKRLARPQLPRAIGVVTGEGGQARHDVLAGLRRRGWHGRLIWAFAPVQDRRAAGAVTRALQDLAALPDVDVVVVARGGGSISDLAAFSDEGLCRTVALLRVPVIASIGHHADRTLLDDVAAVSCSTPTHAAEAAVPVHPGQERATLARAAARLARHTRLAGRERMLAAHAAALSAHDPQRVLARGYAMVAAPDGAVVTSRGAARAARAVRLTFGDGAVDADVR